MLHGASPHIRACHRAMSKKSITLADGQESRGDSGPLPIRCDNLDDVGDARNGPFTRRAAKVQQSWKSFGQTGPGTGRFKPVSAPRPQTRRRCWRRVGESNSCTRICNPLRNHSANSPFGWCGEHLGYPAESRKRASFRKGFVNDVPAPSASGFCTRKRPSRRWSPGPPRTKPCFRQRGARPEARCGGGGTMQRL